jgi:mono/diheme cytochrome c family protein
VSHGAGGGGRGRVEVGPDLSDIGLIQTPEYLAESIIEPNALIVTGEGYAGEDGLSRMPEYHDTITLRQLIDIIEYMKTLQGSE